MRAGRGACCVLDMIKKMNLKLKTNKNAQSKTQLCENSQVRIFVVPSRGKESGPEGKKGCVFKVLGETECVKIVKLLVF